MTPDDMKKLAKYFAEALKREGLQFGGGGGDNDNTGNTFSVRSTRRSRGDDSKAPDIAGLDNIISGEFKNIAKRIRDESGDLTRALKGSALRDAHNEYVYSLADLAKTTRNSARVMVDSYKDFIKNNKGQHRVQQDAIDKMTEYNNLIAALINQDGKKFKDVESKNAYRDAVARVGELQQELDSLGIVVTEVIESLDASGKVIIHNIEELEEYNQVTSQLVGEAREYTKQLAELHAKEIDARQKFIKAFGVGIFAMLDDIIGATKSRLQNVQSTTEFFEAMRNGMSPQEMNEWYNATRNARAALGESSQEFSDGMRGVLQQFGYFGADLKKMEAQIGSTMMNAGIMPSKLAGEALLDTIAKIQVLEGVSRDEAAQIVAGIADSQYYMMNAAGMNDDEQTRLIQQQLFATRQIAKSSGISAEYLKRQEEQSVANRYASTVEMIKKAAVAPAYIASMEKALGRTLTPEEKDLQRKKIIGGLTPEEQAKIMPLEKETMQRFAEIKKQQTQELSTTGTLSGSSMGMIPVEVIGGLAGVDVTGMAKEGDASAVRQQTWNAAESGKRYDELVNKSKDSLEWYETMWLELRAIKEGVQKGPLGSSLSAISETIGTIANLVLLRRFGGAGIKKMFSATGNFFNNMRTSAGRSQISGAIGRSFGSVKRGSVGVADKAKNWASNSPVLGKINNLIGGRGSFVPKAAGVLSAALAIFSMGSNVRDISSAEKSGALSPEQAAAKKREAVGKGIGSGIGGAVGATVLGGLLTPILGPFGTVLGGVVGGWLGSTVGGFLGEGIGSFLNWWKNESSWWAKILLYPIGMIVKAFDGVAWVIDKVFPSSDSNNQAAMTSGNTLDENGNIVQPKSEQLAALKGIEENTRTTAKEVKAKNEADAEKNANTRSESQYAARQRNMANEIAEANRANFDTRDAISTSLGNYDAGFGEA